MTETTVIAIPTETLSELYEKDETAWLDAMAELATHGRIEAFDLPNLHDYLTSMAKRDRKEVFNRLVQLMMHLLKWQYQPEKRSGSWRASIRYQRDELNWDCNAGTLRNYADSILVLAYEKARIEAALETGLPMEAFPAQLGLTLDDLLADTELAE